MGFDIKMTDALYDYVAASNPEEEEVLKALRAETAALGSVAQMQISHNQALFMQMMAKISGAQSYVEVGTFTGYSSLIMACAMGPEGHVTTLDKSDDWTQIAQKYWQKAGVADQITLKMGDGLASLTTLLEEGGPDQFDLAFIDADKGRMQHYFDTAIKLVRPGGMIWVDNVLWSGRVADPDDPKQRTIQIRDFNHSLQHDDRVEHVMLGIGDGITIARVL
mgnify:CR=1 FL=1